MTPHLDTIFVIILATITGISVVRWREAERKLQALTPMKDCDFEISRVVTRAGKVTTTAIIYKRKGIPQAAALTTKTVEELTDLFDEAEKNGKKCIFVEITEFQV